MERSVTLKNVDIKFNVEDLMKHLATIASGEKDKKILANLIDRLAMYNVWMIQYANQIARQMQVILDKFYTERVNEYRKSFKFHKIFGFVSSSGIERNAGELALADVKQLINIMTGADDRANTMRAHNDAIQKAMDQLVSMVRDQALDFKMPEIRGMLGKGHEVE